jgi:guanosine-3',5'-bis(diphosphate) 3'-pyrophosphohydrolase
MNDIARLLDAIGFAAERHRDQRRKGPEASPYINHPIALARMLAIDGQVQDVEVLMAAVLHDTVEDTETRVEEIAARFGPQVAQWVAEVTDDKLLPKQRRKDLQVEHAPTLSQGAVLIKLADKTCNLRDIAEAPPASWSLERRREYFDWARKVVDRLPPANARMLRLFEEAFGRRP